MKERFPMKNWYKFPLVCLSTLMMLALLTLPGFSQVPETKEKGSFSVMTEDTPQAPSPQKGSIFELFNPVGDAASALIKGASDIIGDGCEATVKGMDAFWRMVLKPFTPKS